VSYCHECGKELSNSWSPCPICSDEVKKLTRNARGNKILIESFGLIIALGFPIFCILLIFSVESWLGLISIFFFVSLVHTINIITNYTSPKDWKLESDDESESLSEFEEVVGDVSDGNNWLRTRFLLMNGLAIVVSGIGMDSIAMNHIIFWSALIVGGLIWSSPRGNMDEPVTVDDLFDQ
jgi:hypothetical protein|tara:strand:- start:206 stop:745 length:540 start_codon:yes stop_codon:yes gene_type:complete